jgi:hypothetical protein
MDEPPDPPLQSRTRFRMTRTEYYGAVIFLCVTDIETKHANIIHSLKCGGLVQLIMLSLHYATSPRKDKQPAQPNLVPGKNGVLCPLRMVGLGLPAREWTRDPAVVAAGAKRLESGV